MGYICLQIDKKTGAASNGLSDHIERKTMPKNADRKRTHLNRELIKFPDGVKGRSQAIAHRIKSAGVKRKVSHDQVQAICIILSGTHEDMIKIQDSGHLGEWCKDSLQWLYTQFGKDNTVSAVLHMDEKTPHIHATVVPIVTGERRKAKKEQPDGKKKYRKKNPQTARLCADDMLYRAKLVTYHDSYAKAMEKYGLQRGVRGSVARNISTEQWYRDLQRQSKDLQSSVQQLKQQEKEAAKQLKQVKEEINTEKLKEAAVNVTTNIVEGIGSVIGSSKVKKLEKENLHLKQETSVLKQKVIDKKNEIQKWDARHYNEIENLKTAHSQEIDQYDNILKRILTFFPEVNVMTPIIKECEDIGFSDNDTRMLIHGLPVQFTGKLYSKEHNRYFETEHSTLTVEQIPQRNGNFYLCINGISILDWFKEKFQELKQMLGIAQEEDKPSRRLRM